MITFKDEKARSTYSKCSETLKDAVYICSQWCESKQIPFVITRAIDKMIPNVSKTNIHESGRAVDVSVKGWNADELDEFIHDMNVKFSESIGAFSITDGKPRFCVFHVGTAAHLHLQVRP
jgi:hypothetical protein